jgi:hypothetical protein
VRRRRVPSTIVGAAERRIRALAPYAPTVRDAARIVVEELMHDVPCPPTELQTLGQKIGVREILYESFPGSGELHKLKDGYRVVCSSDQPVARQRFTIAHELAHVILARTGRNAPRDGKDVERICDMIATECLMPTSIFEPQIPVNLTLRSISRLADIFGASLMATAIRCAELRPMCVFGVSANRVTWAYGGVRVGALMHLPDQVRGNVLAVLEGEEPQERVFFYADGTQGEYRRFDGRLMKNGSGIFLLTRDVEATTF